MNTSEYQINGHQICILKGMQLMGVGYYSKLNGLWEGSRNNKDGSQSFLVLLDNNRFIL